MSTEPNQTEVAPEQVAKHAPTEQQESRPGVPKRIAVGQTVCNEKNEKGKLCNGHLKEMHTAHPAAAHLRGDDALHQCQTCGALYMGPPMGHVRDPRKQGRYVEKDLAAILRAAGGTLPAYDYPTPNWKPTPFKRVATTQSPQQQSPTALASASPVAAVEPPATIAETSVAQTATTTPAASPVTQSAPPTGDETPEQKRARLAAELRAKYAGAVKPPAKKATETQTSAAQTEGQPASTASASSTATPAASLTAAPIAVDASAAPEGETPEQKRDRIRAELKAKYAGAQAPAKKASPAVTTAAETPVTTPAATTVASALDSSTEADRHRPAAEAQAATGQASAAPLSPAAATASPAAGAETVADLAPEASTELTPGAPADERPQAEAKPSAAPTTSAPPTAPAPRKAASGSREIPIPPHLLPPPGETMEEKVARLKAQIEASRRGE